MTIITTPELFTPEGIAKIEEMKNAKYICETCLRGRDGDWINSPVAVFANNSPANIPNGGSRWFALFYRYDSFSPATGGLDQPTLYIANAISALAPFQGVVAKNGDIIYSRYRHDYRKSPDGSVFVDGGRDYLRTGPSFGTVDLQIVGDELKVI